jgi:LuxR family transcriptional regulator, maltose regulon positive regulatory protein
LKARALAPGVNSLLVGNADVILAHAYREIGLFAEAIQAYREALPLVLGGGNLVAGLGCYCNLLRLQVTQGMLREAAQLGDKGLAFVQERGIERLPVSAVIFTAVAEIEFEHNRLAEAHAALETAVSIGKYGGSLEYVRAKAAFQAQLLAAEGMSEEAIKSIDGACAEMKNLGARDVLRELQAIRAGLLARCGRSGEAVEWMEGLGSDYAPRTGYTFELEAINLVRVLISMGREPEALDLCNRIAELFSKNQHIGRLIETLVLRSMIQTRLGDPSGAHADLERAHAMGDPQGYVRIFMEDSLWISQPAPPQVPFPIPSGDLVEGLTPRELEVLRLVAEGLSNQQIASRLFLSLATVKKHTSSILGKLGAANRTQAIAVARQLGLL